MSVKMYAPFTSGSVTGSDGVKYQVDNGVLFVARVAVAALEAAGYVRAEPSRVKDIGITLPKEAGIGIQLDVDSPVFGWRDIIGAIELRGVGSNDPTFATYTGTALRAYSFSATVMKEVFMVFHIPHDYAPGTEIYFHAHWSNAAETPDTGTVAWGFDYTFARGFAQQAFPALATVKATQASSATRYMHHVTETGAVAIPTLEVDGLLLVRVFRDAANDTCSDAVFLHTADIHYQSTNISTKNKAPSFYE